MRIVVIGGSGLIGKKLVHQLLKQQHEVILLSRSPDKSKSIFPSVRAVYWDAKSDTILREIFQGNSAIINLSGESIASKRWTHTQKQKILSSRIESTRAIVSAIRTAKENPTVLLQASAVGYYGDTKEDEVTESHPRGSGFLSDVCEQWEAEALKAQESGVRIILVRTGIVLDTQGGALQKLLVPFRVYMGGPLGSGRQWFPWIHVQDEVRAILFSLEHESISGPINLSAPNPERMSDFCNTLGQIIHRPSWLPVPEIILKAAFGEMAESFLLLGDRVIPEKLLKAGFHFTFSTLESALRDILRA